MAISKTSDDLRAFSKVAKRKTRIVARSSVSSYSHSVENEDFFHYMFVEDGVVRKASMFVEDSKNFDVVISTQNGSVSTSITISAKKGVNKIEDFYVKSGDRVSLKADGKADGVWIAFTYIYGG